MVAKVCLVCAKLINLRSVHSKATCCIYCHMHEAEDRWSLWSVTGGCVDALSSGLCYTHENDAGISLAKQS